MLTIAVDAMGSEHAPKSEVEGAIRAAEELQIRVILVGLDPHEMMVDPTWALWMLTMLAAGAGGVALIWWALRRGRDVRLPARPYVEKMRWIR